jgi:YVTN family beta-propeller protein
VGFRIIIETDRVAPPTPENSKSETRNPKQIQNPKDPNAGPRLRPVSYFGFGTFGLVSSFMLGASDSRPPAGQDPPRQWLSPQVLVEGKGSVLYVAAATSEKLVLFDPTAEKVVGEIPLPGLPNGMVLAPDGLRLYVTTDSPAGEVYVVDTATRQVNLLAKAGHTPNAPVLSPDGKTLYICNRFNNDVSVVDTSSGATLRRLPVLREPVAAAITPDGTTLVVANQLPVGRSDGDYVAAAVSLLDISGMGLGSPTQNSALGVPFQPMNSDHGQACPEPRERDARATPKNAPTTIALPNGSTALQGLCLSPDGAYAYVTHILGRYQLFTGQLERGWVNTNALSIIDLKSRQWVNTVLLDGVDLGAANPWDVKCTPDGGYLVVTLSGTHELCLIDRAGLHARLAKAAAGERLTPVTKSAEDVPNDFSFLLPVRRRVKLPGKGPRGLAVVGTKVFAAEYFTDSLGVLDLDRGHSGKARSVPLQTAVPLSEARRGEMLFHDATLCFQQWQSCASCHPGDGRMDVLNWDLLNDGIGNPKNTKSLILAHRTPPSMSLGVRADAQAAVRAGLRAVLFAVRPDSDAFALYRYIESLTPVPSPYLADGKLAPAAGRGQQIFREAGCSSCHNGPYYTNGKLFDVGTGSGLDSEKAFDTPTLIEVWRTAPYLHDGRAATIRDVLTVHNPQNKHGRTSQLTEEQLSDLVEFVLTR